MPPQDDRTGPSPVVLEPWHLMDYVRVLHKRRWSAILVLFLIVGTAAYSTFTAIPIYEARAQLLIEADNPNIVTFKEVIEQDRATIEYYQTQYRILQSRSLARRTIDALKLWSHPEFGGRQVERKPAFSITRSAGNAMNTVVTYASTLLHASKPTQDVQAAASDETTAEARIIDAFLSALTVAPVPDSRLVEVGFHSTDPSLAAKVANALADTYIEQNLEVKFLASKQASDWLAQQLVEQRKQVEASEVSVQRYREKTDAIASEDRQNIVVQKLAELNAAVTRAKTERIAKEAQNNQIRTVQQDPATQDSFLPILSNPLIQQLKGQLADLQRQQADLSARFGDRHPDMIKLRSLIETTDRRLQQEVGHVVQSIHNEVVAVRAQEQSLAEALEAQKREALLMKRKNIEYDALERDARTDRQIFESLLHRAKETTISGELKTNNIRVVDKADVPRSPISPRKRRDLLLALFGGLTLAVGVAFFFEYLDTRIKSPDEIKVHLGLPYLGLVPAIPRGSADAEPLINNGVPPKFVEAFRTIRTSLLFSFPENRGRSIVVTSVGPGEGKTLVASNLAIALAQAGQRVVLVDADLRRPRLHKIFGHQQEPGLSDLIIGKAKVSEVVRKSHIDGLSVLPAGSAPPNPAELLLSPRFKGFISKLPDAFDWVITDSPPVMAVTDASIVAHVVSGVLFVVGSEMTSRHAAQVALEQLDSAKASFVGAVLNRVDLERNAFYFSQYYRREYGDYYTARRKA